MQALQLTSAPLDAVKRVIKTTIEAAEKGDAMAIANLEGPSGDTPLVQIVASLLDLGHALERVRASREVDHINVVHVCKATAELLSFIMECQLYAMREGEEEPTESDFRDSQARPLSADGAEWWRRAVFAHAKFVADMCKTHATDTLPVHPQMETMACLILGHHICLALASDRRAPDYVLEEVAKTTADEPPLQGDDPTKNAISELFQDMFSLSMIDMSTITSPTKSRSTAVLEAYPNNEEEQQQVNVVRSMHVTAVTCKTAYSAMHVRNMAIFNVTAASAGRPLRFLTLQGLATRIKQVCEDALAYGEAVYIVVSRVPESAIVAAIEPGVYGLYFSCASTTTINTRPHLLE